MLTPQQTEELRSTGHFMTRKERYKLLFLVVLVLSVSVLPGLLQYYLTGEFNLHTISIGPR